MRKDDMTAYTCALCGAPYTLDQPRRTTRYCAPCRERRRVERKRLLNAQRNRTRDNVVDVLDEYTRQGMSPDYVDMMRERIGEVIDEVMPAWREHPELPISGALTPEGPDEGTSTYFTDLADELDAHAARVAEQPWWSDNPGWADGLAFDEVDENLRSA